MLETEEVDIDYFTPASSTSLAKIFSNNLKVDDELEKNSLKYVPPPSSQVPTTQEEPKPTQCIYATALYAYQWLKDSYISKERVGFAIMKISKSGLHNMVLYDSNKSTLSCLTITPTTEIHLKENISLSYYDNQRKYWNVYTNPHELSKIVKILKELNVILNHSKDEEEISTNENIDNKNIEAQLMPSLVTNQLKKEDKESDTDSSVNKRTKQSILKRMATMGQSVLPQNQLATVHTSDSSDSNETNNQHKTKHKPFKSTNRRILDKNFEYDKNHDTQLETFAAKPVSLDITTNPYKTKEQQIIPIRTFDIINSPINISDGSDTSLFISEQRVSNSEFRINLNRITDKLDILLDKVKDSNDYKPSKIQSNTSSQFQNEIVQKLLNEYERKIKTYEEFIKSKGFECDNLNEIIDINSKTLQQKAQVSEDITHQLEELCKEKDKEMYLLKEEIHLLSAKLDEQKSSKDIQSDLIKEITNLKENLSAKNDEIASLNKQLETVVTNDRKNYDITNKLKEIMNDTFQTISSNFDNDGNYTGAVVKSTVASVIKKTTMNSLKDS